MTAQNKRLVGIVAAVPLLLLVPLVAMQVTTDVFWTELDFVLAGALLLGTGLACELVLRTVRNRGHRFLLCAVVLLGLALAWLELAVGLFGTPLADS